MRVVFVYGGYDSLGLEYLSAVLKKAGVEVFLAFDPRLFADHYTNWPLLAHHFDRRERVVKRALEFEPDLIAFSVVTDDYQWALSIAWMIKAKCNVPILFGGAHPTSVPERVIAKPQVDYLLIGECEEAIVDLAKGLEAGEVPEDTPNLWIKKHNQIISNPPRPLIENLDLLPFPDKELFYAEMPFLRRDYRTITSRGCAYHCSYCVNDLLRRLYEGRGPFLRRRSVENVIQELRLAKRRYRPARVQFYDDVFTSHPEWLREFAPRYRNEIGLPFWCSANPLCIDREVVGLLKDMGCMEIQLGVQTVADALRSEILHRAGSNEDNLRAIRLVREAGIKCVADNISGLPGETEEDLLAALDFYIEAKPSRISDYRLRYYPRTKIMDIARDLHVLSRHAIRRIEEGEGSSSFALGGTPTAHAANSRLLAMLHLIPVLPRFVSKLLLRSGLYRLLSPKVIPLQVIRRLVDVILDRDINARRYFLRYVHYLTKR